MEKSELEKTIQHGIYGTPEIKPEERNLFLQTLRERIYIALTIRQVRRATPYEEVIRIMRSRKNATLYLNGELERDYFKSYIRAANENGVSYTFVRNGAHSTPIALIVATDKAVDQEDIFIKDERYEKDMTSTITH